MSWVDIDDAVGLYLFALGSGAIRGPLNVAAPDPRRQSEFARALGAALHRPSWFPTPAWIVRLVLRDQASLALGSRRIWPARALASGYVFSRPRLEDSLRNAFDKPGAP
jgi:NAD dependent epimerase/dehydratase family enzyme